MFILFYSIPGLKYLFIYYSVFQKLEPKQGDGVTMLFQYRKTKPETELGPQLTYLQLLIYLLTYLLTYLSKAVLLS